jgi:nucleotide-binding universal stress UspA family protein
MADKYVIVAGIDFSQSSALAMDEAFRIAAEQPGAELHVVHVASEFGPMLRLELVGDEVKTVEADEGSKILKSHVEERAHACKAAGMPAPDKVITQLRLGGSSEEIVRAAAELDADLIVVGTHGRTGVRRLLLGSVAESVVRHAGCPVMVVRRKDYEAEAP